MKKDGTLPLGHALRIDQVLWGSRANFLFPPCSRLFLAPLEGLLLLFLVKVDLGI